MQNWPGQRGSPAAKTRTALLYHKDNLHKPRAWGWAAIAEYGELSELDRGKYILLESFKKYLMPNDFCSKCGIIHALEAIVGCSLAAVAPVCPAMFLYVCLSAGRVRWIARRSERNSRA